MTTTAATTSASSSTSNDSLIQDNNGASEPTIEQHQQQSQLQQQSSTTTTPPSPPQATLQQQSSSRTATPPGGGVGVGGAATATTTSNATNKQQQSPPSQSAANNNTEQKRPMNAFLLFCKRQRSLVREKYPNLENRGITKILGDWWSKLDKEQKSKYTDLARQHKEAFMKANPDFKWCKTPNVSNINNNNSSSNSNTNNTVSNDCYPNKTNHNHYHQHHPNDASSLSSLQSIHQMDVLQSNSMDISLTNRQQLEAPKPPKKRFLERNDSLYTRNNFTSNHHETSSHGTDSVVPYISLDQDTLDRVIDKAFSEESSNSPSGTNTCKFSNKTSANLTSSLGTNPSSFSSSTSAYSTSVDEPVDFSMNRTINATRQQIINNLVEKMLSEPTDNAGSIPKMNGTDSVQSHPRPPVKKDNPDST